VSKHSHISIGFLQGKEEFVPIYTPEQITVATSVTWLFFNPNFLLILTHLQAPREDKPKIAHFGHTQVESIPMAAVIGMFYKII
jgi:acyl CoA:acetate/3-ketoacid CoA transferase beta subunit